MNSFDEIFSAAKDFCRERVVAASYALFIENLTPVSFENGVVTLRTSSEFLRNMVEQRYTALLKESFKAILGFDVELVLTIPEPTPVPDGPSLPGGNYTYTFENFIVGSTNRFAHAAAQAVAENPSGAYNPLFIWGDSGLGKTHLLSAIKMQIQCNHADYNIVYVDGETFTNGIITAIRENTTAEFHNKYRAADVLLVDDVQFIGGKESTQEEFFHTFNTLYNSGKQIVLTSDRAPKEIKSLEDRLRTRFEMGLIADIGAPEFETRVAIIRRKADLLDLDLPDEVADYIANRLKNNIRQLEGTVKKMNAYRILEGMHPSIGMAQNAIKDILSEQQPVPVTIEKILSEVGRTYNITPEEIRGNSRRSSVSAARKVCMYVVREITGMSMEDIGGEFGGRDHSTVVYSINCMQKTLQTDPHTKETVEDIIKNVRS
ncbi:MAG: chromosomal replication initiator protein DnaA [Ruthenibacterium sp.]